MNKHREKDQTLYLAIAAVLFCLAAFLLIGKTGFLDNGLSSAVPADSTAGMLVDLQKTVDDGGLSDIQQLRLEAKSL